MPWHMLDKVFFYIYIEMCTRVLCALASPPDRTATDRQADWQDDAVGRPTGNLTNQAAISCGAADQAVLNCRRQDIVRAALDCTHS